jgi:hypothetical protein
MSTTQLLDSTPLVAVGAAENTFQVPAVDNKAAISQDTNTVHVGNAVEPFEVFDRDTLIGEFSIASSDSPYVNLTGYFDPFYEYLDDSLIQKYCSPFGQANFDLIVTVRMIAPGSCYGLYNVQFLCDGGTFLGAPDENDDAAEDSYVTSTQDEHSFLNVELKNDIVMELPWTHFLDSYLLSNVPLGPTAGPGCWRICIWSLSPIQNTLSTAVAYGKIQVYARMSKKRVFENLVYQTGERTRHPHPVAADVKPEKKKKKKSEILSSVANGVAMVGGMFPTIAPFAEPLAFGMNAVATMADFFGFTRESAQQAPTPVVRRLTSSLAHTDGQDTSEMVALSVGNTLSIDPRAGGGQAEDVMSYPSLFNRWTIGEIFTITEASSGVIGSVPVTPYAVKRLLGVSYMNTGGYVGLPFSQWRGGMEYMIYIPSAANIQGSLQILWSPPYVAPTGFIEDPTNRLTNVVVDLTGTSRTHLSVGYSQHNPCLASVFYHDGAVGIKNGSVNGHLVFRMLAPLTAPRVTGFSLQIIVMVRPASDMKFGVPTNQILTESAATLIKDIVYQSSVGEEQEADSMVVLSKAANADYPVAETLWGEDFGSVRGLMQHFNTIGAVSTSYNGVYYINGFQHYIPPPRVTTHARWAPNGDSGTTVPFTYFGYYSAPFTGVRGSMRWKILAASTDQIAAWPMAAGGFRAQFATSGAVWPMLYDQQPIGVNMGAEWIFPAYSPWKYFPVRYALDPAVVAPYARYNYLTTNDESIPDAYVSIAGGPDITAVRFRRIPGIILP